MVLTCSVPINVNVCLMSYVLCLMSYVLCLMSYVFCLMSYVFCPMNPPLFSETGWTGEHLLKYNLLKRQNYENSICIFLKNQPETNVFKNFRFLREKNVLKIFFRFFKDFLRFGNFGNNLNCLIFLIFVFCCCWIFWFFCIFLGYLWL